MVPADAAEATSVSSALKSPRLKDRGIPAVADVTGSIKAYRKLALEAEGPEGQPEALPMGKSTGRV